MPEISLRAFLVSIVVLRKIESNFEVLLLKRTQNLAGEWCQVAGKIEENETAWQAAVRELAEETALIPELFYSADINEQFYEAARDSITIAPVFVALVDPSAEVILNEEHSDYRWSGFDEAMELVTFGGQRHVLRWIEAEFVKRVPSKHLLIDIGELGQKT